MFQWRDEYSIHVHSIDAQHRNLFALAQELHDAMSEGRGKIAVAGTLDRLVRYVDTHLAHEERLMEQRQYPALAEHRLEHRQFARQVRKFQQDFESGAAMTVQLLNLLRNWLTHHVCESDQEIAPYLKDRAGADPEQPEVLLR